MSQNHEMFSNCEPREEDTVQCLFCAPSYSDQNSWDNLCKNINIIIESLSKEYLWHKDTFKVFLPINEQNSGDSLLYLASSTSFGDNIEDEWFIVHIILNLTLQFKDLIVQLKDNDGDFLLIEAADHLPPWANPESTENRVFIHNNHIHLIPPSVANLDEKLSLNDAVQLILKASDQTQVSADIEQAILNRVGCYPKKIKDNSHNALVKLPLEIATLLKLKPNLIAPIVDAYCHHDVIDAKAFKNVSYNNWITISVKFTKCLYAMLLYSKVVKGVRQPVEKDKKTILGMKLACGFQIIMKKSSDIYSSKEYLKFLNSLKVNGYFKNNIEGSKEHTKLVQNAKEFFSAVECPTASNVSNDVTQIMSTDEYLKTKEVLLNENMTACNSPEDNDDWLTIHPEQLNELLNSRYGKKTKFQKGDILTPQTITTELKDFLKQTSDFEGIETNVEDQCENDIDFDADQFTDCIEKMLRLLSSNNDNEELESVESDFSDEAMSHSEDEDAVDEEIKERLHGAADLGNSKTILQNMVRSMKEEKASIGPSSNIISSIGLKKTDFLDSDDE